MDREQHIKIMRRALQLARKGAGRVGANPLVGAVIVKAGQIIAQGYHKQFGGPHAEINALNHCAAQGHDPRGATLFVTLEPCCHHGKTGPCTEAIARAGIKNVHIATLDQCSLVNGKGARWLTEHGITVKVGCCEPEARRLNAGFFKLHTTGTPQVILKWAQSIDGRLAWPTTSDQRWITGAKARRHLHQIRSQCGAILVGIGTVLADDPLLTARLGRSKLPQPLRVVLDEQLKLPINSKLVQTTKQSHLLICTLEKAVQDRSIHAQALRAAGAEVVVMPEDKGVIDLHAVLHQLGKRGVKDLLVEGGPTVLSSFQQRHLADKIMAYIAPVIVGGGGDVPVLSFTTAIRELQDVAIHKLDSDLLIEGTLQCGT